MYAHSILRPRGDCTMFFCVLGRTTELSPHFPITILRIGLVATLIKTLTLGINSRDTQFQISVCHCIDLTLPAYYSTAPRLKVGMRH